MTTTDRTDIRTQVIETLGEDFELYDFRAITAELIDTYDLLGDCPRDTVASIEPSTYWGIVAKYQHPDA